MYTQNCVLKSVKNIYSHNDHDVEHGAVYGVAHDGLVLLVYDARWAHDEQVPDDVYVLDGEVHRV